MLGCLSVSYNHCNMFFSSLNKDVPCDAYHPGTSVLAVKDWLFSVCDSVAWISLCHWATYILRFRFKRGSWSLTVCFSLHHLLILTKSLFYLVDIYSICLHRDGPSCSMLGVGSCERMLGFLLRRNLGVEGFTQAQVPGPSEPHHYPSE